MRIVIAASLLLPVAALAASPFTGTWMTRADSMKSSGTPDVFLVMDGTYTCSSCVPEIRIRADGTDQKVTGHPYYDTVAVKVVSATAVELSDKLAGRQTVHVRLTVSPDGKTLTGDYADDTGAKTATGSFQQRRVAAGPAGSHAMSGSWQDARMVSGNEATRTVHYAMTADGFSSQWNGLAYSAKFDGRQYPIKGDPGHTLVEVRKIDDHTVLEIDRRLGKVTDEMHMAVASDGKSVAVIDHDLNHGRIVTFTLDRQRSPLALRFVTREPAAPPSK